MSALPGGRIVDASRPMRNELIDHRSQSILAMTEDYGKPLHELPPRRRREVIVYRLIAALIFAFGVVVGVLALLGVTAVMMQHRTHTAETLAVLTLTIGYILLCACGLSREPRSGAAVLGILLVSLSALTAILSNSLMLFLIGAIAFAASAAMLTVASRMLRHLAVISCPWQWQRDSLSRGQCPNCGYEVWGLDQPRCPECGSTWPLA